jgi:zinc protease
MGITPYIGFMTQLIHRIRHFVLFAIALMAPSAFAFKLPLTEFKLDNGLQLIVIEDHRAPVVLHAVGYRVGGADEQPGKTGLAHFFEHLMFRGTSKFPGDKFSVLMDENGAERNAFTMQDMTTYYERGNVDMLDLMMELEADRMQNLVLTDDVFETERKVVQEERRQQTESSPFALAGEKLDAALFTTHPYGRPVVGIAADVAALTRDDAYGFYRTHYMPATAIVLVVGDVQPEAVRALAEQRYGGLKNPAAPPLRQRPAEPSRAMPGRIEFEDARVNDPTLIRKYVTPARTKVSERASAALIILSSILGGDSESRFETQLVLSSGDASAAAADYNGQGLDYGAYQIYAVPAPGRDVLQLEAKVDAILADVVKNGVTQAELDRAKNTALAAFIYQLDDPAGFGVGIGMAIATGVARADIYNRDVVLGAVTREDVQAAARQLFTSTQNVTMIVRPKK